MEIKLVEVIQMTEKELKEMREERFRLICEILCKKDDF